MHQKYTRLQIALHWGVFILVIIAWLSMDFRHSFPRTMRPFILTLHASCGLCVGILMALRILLRFRNPAPAIEPAPPVWAIGLAHLGQLIIWLLFLALPILGVLTLWYKGGDWRLFGVSMPVAAIPDGLLKTRYKSWHELLATVSYWAIALHAAAALAHHFLWRDNTLRRMMPGKR